MRHPLFCSLVAFALATLAGGCGVPSFLITPVSSSSTLEESVVKEGQGWSPKKIVIIPVEGMILNAKQGGLLQATENDLSLFTQQVQKAQADSDVAAIVLRVNSPGGTVTASDAMYQELLRFREKSKKPIVADCQDVAASGAYYVSCAADKIVASPTSVVGSIGVIFQSFDARDFLEGKLGIIPRAIHSGTLKEMGSPFKHAQPLEDQIMQEMVNEYFARFESIVKSRRPVTENPPAPPATQPATYAGIYSGRVFSGTEALRLGLVDQLGLLDDAIDLAKTLSNAKNAQVVLYKRPYGYTGSIYASSQSPTPQANVININLPQSSAFVPAGFYYLWQP